VTTIDEVIGAIPDWAGRRVAAREAVGGLTNRNYFVDVDADRYFVRIPGADTDLLAVDRENELYNTRAAGRTGVGPAVAYALAELGAFVLKFIPGVTMSNDRLREPGMPNRVAASLRLLHAGPRFLREFDMFRLAERYLALCDERHIPIPAGYRERLDRVPRIERALAVHPLPTVPCHNDLLAENYIDDGSMLRIVDYEYSGNNDPCFELGNTCQELGWDETRQMALCAAYFGAASDALMARMRLQMIMSDVGWTLWAAIQARISPIEYDFWGWAVERWTRAAAALDGPDFEGWLSALAS
jgi:thiamine kinase-like enzyme